MKAACRKYDFVDGVGWSLINLMVTSMSPAPELYTKMCTQSKLYPLPSSFYHSSHWPRCPPCLRLHLRTRLCSRLIRLSMSPAAILNWTSC